MDISTLKETLSSEPRTVDSLVPVKEYLISLQASDKSSEFIEVVKECADASRDEDWRVPIGDSGILELVADLLDSETAKGKEANVELQVQTLRLCGNACAEKDVNRGRMVSRTNGMKSLVKAITNDNILKFGIPVLYNICLDYEDTQKQAIKDGVGEALFTLLQRGNILDDEDDKNVLGGALVEHLLMITELLVKHDEFKDTLDPSSISVLIKLILSPNLTELETYAYILHITTALLSHETFQSHLINTSTVESLLDILEDSYSRFSDDEEEAETARKMLTQLRKGLIIGLSDVSCNTGFTEKYPLDSSPLLKKLHSWLSHSTSAENKGDAKYLLGEALQTSACIMLGNVATSDAACLSLVNSHSIHIPLIAIMGQKDKDHGTVFSAVGMLRNLVLPTLNKAVVGKPETGIWQALESRWLHGIEGGIEKQVPYAVSGLGRLLVKGNRENSLRLVENSSHPLLDSDDIKTATRLSMLLKLYVKSDEIPTKTEIARTICEVLRCVAGWKRQASNSLQVVDEGTVLSIETVQNRIFNSEGKYLYHEMIPEVIGGMVSQDKWPSIRSEGIFALGLLAAGFGGDESEKRGARLVWGVKRDWWTIIGGQDEKKVEEGKILGEVSPESGEGKEEDEEKSKEEGKENKKPALEGKDFANALVLVVEVRRRLDSELETHEKAQLDDLLKALTSSQPGVRLVT